MKPVLTLLLLLLATLLCSCTTSLHTGPRSPVRPGWTHKTIFGLPLPLSFSHTIYF